MTAPRSGAVGHGRRARQRFGRLGRVAIALGLVSATLPFAATSQEPAKAPSVVGSRHGAAPNEARTVRGRVVRGTRAALQPVANRWVVLHRVGTDRAAPLDSMRTDGAGRFAFAYRTSGDAGAVYFVSSSYGGIAYFSAPLNARDVRGEDAELVVHDTTSAPIPIRVRGRHVLFAAPGEQKRRPVLEVVELSNDSMMTRVAVGDSGAVWQGLLLDGAKSARVERSDFSRDAVRFAEGRVRLSAPFAPGLKQFSFAYDVSAEASYAFPVEEPTDVLEVLVEDALGRAEGGGLISARPTNLGGRTFARFVAQDVPAGAVIRVSTPGTGAASANQLRVLAILAALGAALLVGLTRAMFRRQGRARSSTSAQDIEALRAELAALDEAFAGIAAPTEEQRADHWQARAHLTTRISNAVAREQGLA